MCISVNESVESQDRVRPSNCDERQRGPARENVAHLRKAADPERRKTSLGRFLVRLALFALLFLHAGMQRRPQVCAPTGSKLRRLIRSFHSQSQVDRIPGRPRNRATAQSEESGGRHSTIRNWMSWRRKQALRTGKSQPPRTTFLSREPWSGRPGRNISLP